MWFHAAMYRNEPTVVITKMKCDIKDVGRTALFEAYLVNALVPDGNPIDTVFDFAVERIRYAHTHMTVYSPL